MKIFIGAGLTALTFALMGMAGNADYEDAKASEADYCKRVLSGKHTDYLELGGVCYDRY